MPPDRIRLTPEGVAANPDLAGREGVVEFRFAGGVKVRFSDGRSTLWCLLKDSYVEAADGG